MYFSFFLGQMIQIQDKPGIRTGTEACLVVWRGHRAPAAPTNNPLRTLPFSLYPRRTGRCPEYPVPIQSIQYPEHPAPLLIPVPSGRHPPLFCHTPPPGVLPFAGLLLHTTTKHTLISSRLFSSPSLSHAFSCLPSSFFFFCWPVPFSDALCLPPSAACCDGSCHKDHMQESARPAFSRPNPRRRPPALGRKTGLARFRVSRCLCPRLSAKGNIHIA